jgi:hypothetical protein
MIVHSTASSQSEDGLGKYVPPELDVVFIGD